MIKRFFTIVALVAITILSANAQILYRITSDSQQKPSYIIGTFHLEDGNYIDSIPGARAVLNEVEQVYGELDMSYMTNPDTLAALNQAQMLDDGKTLKDVLTAEQFDKLDSYTEKVFGTKFSNPMLYQQMGNIKPMGLENTITILTYLKKAKKKFDINNSIDSYVQKAALDMGKKIGGLETYSFQMETLFGRPLSEQIHDMMCSIDNSEYYEEQMVRLANYYHAQDAEKLMEETLIKMNNGCDPSEEYLDALLFNRNRNWVKKIPGIVREHSTLFAVGAGHLGGEKGVLNLLRKAGFKVEGVK